MAKFIELPIREWKGRYNRNIGNNDTVFHIKKFGDRWHPTLYYTSDSEQLMLTADDCKGSRDLTRCVNRVKKELGDRNGGSFIVNEYKQVIVPVLWIETEEGFLLARSMTLYILRN